MPAKKLTICGLAAVRALFARDAAAIERLYFDYPTGRKIGVICKVLAGARKIYRCVEPDELARIAGTAHHGGIVAMTAPRELRAPRPEEVQRWSRAGDPLLLVDRIGNAHNLGAVVRTAAFFGVKRLVIPDHPQQALPGEAAYRVAEGGMEHVEIYRVTSLAAFIRQLRPAYTVIGSAVRGAAPPTRGPAPGGGKPRPVALVLGNEEQGLAPEVAAACERLVMIPGGGAVESLNVSAAAAVLCWEYFGRR